MVRFRDNPATSIPDLQREVKNVVDQLNRDAFVIVRNVSIGTTSTAVAHGLRGIPRAAVMAPRDLVSWCQSDDSDSRNVYFKASVATTADVVVFP